MRRLRRTIGLALSAALLTAVPVPAQPAPAAPKATGSNQVLLITGDRVLVSPDLEQVRTIPGPGRGAVRFMTYRSKGRVSVVPIDALPLLAAERLDPRLFDLTELVRRGTSDGLPVIMSSAAALGSVAATSVRELPTIGATAATVPAADLPGFFSGLRATGRSKDSPKVWLDARREPVLDRSVPKIGAPAAWSAGYTGRGVKVAVLDSGVDATHPDLAGRLTEADFTGTGTADEVGHGTHVASILAGTGAAGGDKYRGVAPDAEILSGKVCASLGCDESAILAGMHWAVEQGARIVNLSLGGFDFPGLDPIETAVNDLTASSGTLFVVAAGNLGPWDSSIASPGSAAAALTVGAVDHEDRAAEFSSRGPTLEPGPIKPDLTAPGVGIVAARSATTEIGEPVGDKYLRASGTSMSTPHVAGAAAILAQQHPAWRAAELKAALTGSAVPSGTVNADTQGSGRVDVAAATRLPVTADTTLTFAEQRWPHHDDIAEKQVVTYRNHTDQPVTLTLTASFTAPDGEPAPRGAIALDAETLTVPARGTAKVQATSDTDHSGPDGRYLGRVIATSASGPTVGTTLSVHKEVESYDLTVSHLDRSGRPTTDFNTALDNLADTVGPLTLDNSGPVSRLRLPKGIYELQGIVGLDSTETSYLVMPRLDLAGDVTVTVDARQARPIAVTVPEPGAAEAEVSVRFSSQLVPTRSAAGTGSSTLTKHGSGATLFTAQIGPSLPGSASMVASHWAAPTADGTFANSPYIYALAWPVEGFPTGFSRDVKRSELAQVQPELAARAKDSIAWVGYNPSTAAGLEGNGVLIGYNLPARPVVRVNSTGGVGWSGMMIFFSGAADHMLRSERRVYQSRHSYDESWGKAVMGAVVTASSTRTGEQLELLPITRDAAGNFGGVPGQGTLALYRDSKEVGRIEYPTQKGGFTVPASPGQYRAELVMENPHDDISTAIRSVWTFRSETTSTATPLPLWNIRFKPVADDHNVVSGRAHVLPLTAEPVPGADTGKVAGLKLKVSFDGKTWQDVPVRAAGGVEYLAPIRVPAGAEAVSLRATLTDTKGNSVDQTVTRAYKVAS